MGGKALDPDYHRNYYRRNRARLVAAARAWYEQQRRDPAFLAKRKEARELRHFGTDRDTIMATTGRLCAACGQPAEVIHHVEYDGRGHETVGALPGKDPDFLLPFCRACHINEHRFFLQLAQRAYNASRWARHYDACVNCGRTDRKHCGRGYCRACHKRLMRQTKSPACSL